MDTLTHLSKFKDLAWLFAKYGHVDLIQKMGIATPDSQYLELGTSLKAEQLAEDLQKLGPTYIKLGQILSTQIDVLSKPYQEALSNLQDNVEPIAFENIDAIVTAELGVKISQAFAEFNKIPLAAASLSQVHLAKLKDGREVVVKIQRPGLQEQARQDIETLEELAVYLDKTELLGKNFYWSDRIDSLKKIYLNELDFKKEAHHLKTMAKNLKDFSLIHIPQPIDDYTTAHILTMEYISSRKIPHLDPVLKLDVDGEKLVKELLRAYLKQIFIDGFVHIDPHPGNIYLTDDNEIAILDLGMVDHMPMQFRNDLLKLFLSIAEGKGEIAAELIVKMGRPEKNFEFYAFQNEAADLIARYQDLSWSDFSFGQIFLALTRLAAEHNLRLPQKFNTLGKTLLNLDSIGKILAPHLNLNQFFRENIENLMQQKMRMILTEGMFSNFALESFDFLSRLPAKMNGLLENLNKNDWKIKLQAFDEQFMMKGFEKIANRIALGLVLAAMILSAALLLRVPSSFQILGYPGIAIILFSAAFLGGVLFLFNVLRNDGK